MILMTDGYGSDNQVFNILQSKEFKAAKSKMKSFKLFCVGFRHGYEQSSLENYSKWANDDKLEYIEDGEII